MGQFKRYQVGQHDVGLLVQPFQAVLGIFCYNFVFQALLTIINHVLKIRGLGCCATKCFVSSLLIFSSLIDQSVLKFAKAL